MQIHKKLCFVIMGFGKKSDLSSGKTYDLDKTYHNIIKIAVSNAGYDCVRADEIQDSSLIDRSMYALLIHADLVIADITTYNPNAIYELGIRHAVKPFSTIILKEQSGKIPFDLDHTRMFQYTHLGEDIGADESKRCQDELTILIKTISDQKSVDSPLYEYIKDITPPKLAEEEYERIVKDLAEKEKHIFAITDTALKYMSESNFIEASKFWTKASNIINSEPYFIQQHALCKYKSKSPSENTALIDALTIINQLDPEGSTNDPETLGITGAIYKNLWLLNSDLEYLNRAIFYYGKCFKIRNDYYTGENYALCLNMKQSQEKDEDEKIYLKIEARKTRELIVSLLEEVVESEEFKQRVDKKWVYATLSQCYYFLQEKEISGKYQTLFLESQILDWEKETFFKTRTELGALIEL